MQKDFVASAGTQDEAAFVAAFWDERWTDADLAADASRLAGTEEFAFTADSEPRLATGGLDVLDCGCGRGDWTRMLRARGHRAVGMDLAPQVIARLRERWPDWFSAGDFRQTGLPDAAFDLVLNWGGIEHFEDGPQAALVEAHRVLRSGGCAVVSTPCHNARGKLREALGLQPRIGDGAAPPGQRFYQYRFTPAELAAQLAQAGFVDVRTRVIGGEQGLARSLEHELRFVGQLLPGRVARGLARVGGKLLRPWLGHMVIASGRKR